MQILLNLLGRSKNESFSEEPMPALVPYFLFAKLLPIVPAQLSRRLPFFQFSITRAMKSICSSISVMILQIDTRKGIQFHSADNPFLQCNNYAKSQREVI